MKDNSVNILLVEDDEVDAMNVKRAFKKTNICNPLFHAGNGLEALDMLRGTGGVEKIIPKPRIILLDLNMPRMNGIEFLHELRADPELHDISVVVLTTSNEERDKVAAYNLNVAGYILKPVEPERFIEAIGTLNLYWNLIELP
ncbi:MAG: response regulator [Gammaproteobacteria bacterium]